MYATESLNINTKPRLAEIKKFSNSVISIIQHLQRCMEASRYAQLKRYTELNPADREIMLRILEGK